MNIITSELQHIPRRGCGPAPHIETGVLVANQLVAQLVGISTLIGVVFTISLVINLVIELFVGHRVSAETELAGLDIPEMGQLGYPEFVLTPVHAMSGD